MNQLREIRKKRGVTQFELGKVINVHPQKISEVELGKKDIRFQEAIKAAQFLNVTLDELAGMNENIILAPSNVDNASKSK